MHLDVFQNTIGPSLSSPSSSRFEQKKREEKKEKFRQKKNWEISQKLEK